jgi:hypothetical protein
MFMFFYYANISSLRQNVGGESIDLRREPRALSALKLIS